MKGNDYIISNTIVCSLSSTTLSHKSTYTLYNYLLQQNNSTIPMSTIEYIIVQQQVLLQKFYKYATNDITNTISTKSNVQNHRPKTKKSIKYLV